MGAIKYLDFDYYLNRVKAGDGDFIFSRLVREISPHISVSDALMRDIISKRAMVGGMNVENGVCIFDIATDFVKKPVSAVFTLEHEIDLQASDSKFVDLFVAVISPSNNVSAHLQRLSAVARLFRSRDLCGALRGSCNADEMKVLFMPTQDWMVAA